MNHKIYRRAIFIFIIAIVLVSCNKKNECTINIQNKETFDSSKWFNGNERIRGSMAQDLIDKGILEGKSKNDIKNFLGPPDKENAQYIIYIIDVGIKFGETPWPYYLNIRLDTKTSLFIEAIISD